MFFYGSLSATQRQGNTQVLKMETFDKNYSKYCSAGLSDSEDPNDVLRAWLNLGGLHPELSAIVALPKYERTLTAQKRIIDSPIYRKYLVHYFTKANLYFIDDELLNNTFKNKEVKIPVDYTLAFYTNLSSYIKTIVKGGNLGGQQGEIIKLLDQLLVDDVNYDHLFYLIENTKIVYALVPRFNDTIKPFEFWIILNKEFRWNLVSLELFRGVDCNKYKRTSSPESIFSFRESFRNVEKYTFIFYASESGFSQIKHLLRFQRLILLYLLGMYKIQFTSKNSGRKIIEEYFLYIQDSIGTCIQKMQERFSAFCPITSCITP